MRKACGRFFIIFLFSVLLIFPVLLPNVVLAVGERSIFIGDMISVKVSTLSFSESEIRDKFKDFEIVNITQEEDGFLVTLRSFEVGEKTVELGDKEIKINVKSTLDEIKRDKLFEGKAGFQETNIENELQIAIYILLLLFIVCGTLLWYKSRKAKKDKMLTPYQYFNRQISKLILSDDKYFVNLTHALKEYIELKYLCRIKGKTSSEMVAEINSIPELQRKIPLIRPWLEESDYFKFAGVTATNDKKREMQEKLGEIVTKINCAREESV